MSEFNAAHTMDEIKERAEQAAEGGKLIAVLAAIIAVLAALATLFANHSSISGLATKNEAILTMSKASDQYNYYESKRIKVQLNQALITTGLVTDAAARKKMTDTIAKEDAAAKNSILPQAQRLERQSDDFYDRSEQFMQSYEKFEVAATLFEVSIVLVSITALMRTRVLLYAGGVTTLVGIVFFMQALAIRG
jgi:hypothetical protein